MGYTIKYKTTLGQPATVVESADPATVKIGDTVRMLILGMGGDMRGAVDKVGIVTRAENDGDMMHISLDNGAYASFCVDLAENDDRAIQII